MANIHLDSPTNEKIDVIIATSFHLTSDMTTTDVRLYINGILNRTTNFGQWTGHKIVYAAGNLAYSTTYNWYVEVWVVGVGWIQSQETWSFTTVPPYPNKATTPTPLNNATGVYFFATTLTGAITGTFTKDEVVSQATSGATGKVLVDTTGAGPLYVSVISGTFVISEIVTGLTGTQTPSIVNPPKTVSWVNGGGATSYDVWFGITGHRHLVQAGVTETSLLIPDSFISTPDYECSWRILSNNDGNQQTLGDIWAFTYVLTCEKPINPGPTDAAENVINKTEHLDFERGSPEDYPDETYDIYFAPKGYDLVALVTDVEYLSLKSPYIILNIDNFNPTVLSGYRSPQVGDVLSDDDNTYAIYGIEKGEQVNSQFEAKLYAFRIGPGDKVAGDVLTNGVAPDVNNPQAVSVRLNDNQWFKGDPEESYLPSGMEFLWRVDAKNVGGTTTGDVWSFKTVNNEINKFRPSFYLPDYFWNPATQEWQLPELSGGGRYKEQIVVIGHKKIFFGEV